MNTAEHITVLSQPELFEPQTTDLTLLDFVSLNGLNTLPTIQF